MDDVFSKAKDQTSANAGNISAGEQVSLLNGWERDCNHYCENNKFVEQYANKIVEYTNTFNGISKEILKYLKEYPSTEQLVSIFSNEMQRFENLLQRNCLEFERIMSETSCIKDELLLINKLINSPAHGLCEIKKEVRLIEKELSSIAHFCPNVTSGSVIIEDPQTTQLLIAVKNRNLLAHTVRVKVLRDDVCPAKVLSNTCLLVSGCCSNAITVPLSNLVSYEIEVYDLVPGMSVSSIELDICKRRIKCSRLTFSQFFCLTGNCP